MYWNFLPGWFEKLVPARQRQQATDLRIADGTRPLLRRLTGLPDWPNPGTRGQDLSGWAAWLLKGLQEAEPDLKSLVVLRPDASPSVRRAIGEARDHYDQATGLLEALFGKDFSMSAWDDDRRHALGAKLRKAVGHLQAARNALLSAHQH